MTVTQWSEDTGFVIRHFCPVLFSFKNFVPVTVKNKNRVRVRVRSRVRVRVRVRVYGMSEEALQQVFRAVIISKV